MGNNNILIHLKNYLLMGAFGTAWSIYVRETPSLGTKEFLIVIIPIALAMIIEMVKLENGE